MQNCCSVREYNHLERKLNFGVITLFCVRLHHYPSILYLYHHPVGGSNKSHCKLQLPVTKEEKDSRIKVNNVFVCLHFGIPFFAFGIH